MINCIPAERCDQFTKDIYNSYDYEDPSWDTLINQYHLEPFNIEAIKKLKLGSLTPEQLQYEELNMSCTTCSPDLQSALEIILLGANMRGLKKLSTNFCLCKQDDNARVATKHMMFKKRRLGLGSSVTNNSVLEKIVQNSPFIQELELWQYKYPYCSSLSKITNSSLASIQYLVNLKQLTLTGLPQQLRGEFLIDICKGCRQLESLRIQAENQNRNLSDFVSLALRYAAALKDFRYVQPYINMNKIMGSFDGVSNAKLERLVLQCRYIETFDVRLFESFLYKNPQLKFLYILIKTKLPKTVIQTILKTVKKFKVCPQNVFVVVNDDCCTNNVRLSIPVIHRKEMLECHSNVCVLDILNGFVKK